MRWEGQGESGAAPLVGVILLVGVVVVIGATLTMLALGFLDGYGTPTAEAKFSYERTAAGLEMTPQALSTDVVVQLNGEDIAEIAANASGQPVLVPTAPGDEITVVSRDGDRSVLIRKRIDDRSEIGDFIAYYTFDGDSTTTLEDQSGNGNDGTLDGDPKRRSDGSLRFDGDDDYVSITGISAPVDVEAFTIAVAYKQREHDGDGTGNYKKIDQLVEHQNASTGNEWYLETKPTSTTDYRMDYAVEYPNEIIKSSESFALDDRYVAIGTYDGSTYTLYMNGEKVESKSFSRSVDMGDMTVGRDFESSLQYFEGDIYELRLYYKAFDAKQVRTVTNAMS